MDREGLVTDYSFPPKYSEHTESVLKEAGLSPQQTADLRAHGIIP